MEDTMKVRVKNRLNSPVIYYVPDMGNLRREYSGQEEKIITFEEVRKVAATASGEILLKDYLVIEDKEVLEQLGFHVEPEYFYGKEEVVNLLKNGSMDQFLDCLDFAPQGVIDLVKEQAVRLPLNDVQKREALLEKFGFNVGNVLNVIKMTNEGSEPEDDNKTSKRRAAARSTADQTQPKTRRSGARVTTE